MKLGLSLSSVRVGDREGGAGINVFREGDGSCGAGDGTRRSRLPENGGGERTVSRLSFAHILPMGEEEVDLVYLCVSAELETWLGSRVMCGVAVPFAKKA